MLGFHRRLEQRPEVGEQRVVVGAPQRVDELPVGGFPQALEMLPVVSERRLLVGLQPVLVDVEVHQMHVQVADAAERAGDPAQSRHQAIRFIGRKHGRERTQRRAGPADGDAHLVDALRMDAFPRVGLVELDLVIAGP